MSIRDARRLNCFRSAHSVNLLHQLPVAAALTSAATGSNPLIVSPCWGPSFSQRGDSALTLTLKPRATGASTYRLRTSAQCVSAVVPLKGYSFLPTPAALALKLTLKISPAQ